MYDRHEAQDGRTGHDLPQRDAAGEGLAADRPMADREVPLPGTPGASSMALHQWLDGDLAEAEARRADAKQVEFWARLTAETDRRRRMTTPAHVSAAIMASLPDAPVAMRADARLADARLTSTQVEPSRIAGISMTVAVMVGAAMFALGIVVGRML